MNIKAAFIGLGNMGAPMAQNLSRGVSQLTVYDIRPECIETVMTALKANHVVAAANVAEAVADADMVFTSLPGPQHIAQLADMRHGMLASMRRGSVWVEMSTNDLATATLIRQNAESKGIELLDAPVTGGTEGAQAGTLVLLVGGAKNTYEQCLPQLQCLGRARHTGPSGSGYVAKIAQVVLCYLNSVALSEAMMLGCKNGISPDTMLEIIQQSTGNSYVAQRYGPSIVNGDYDPSFALGLATKDLRLAHTLAAHSDAHLPMLDSVYQRYQQATLQYGAEQNHLMAVKLLEDENHTSLQNHPKQEEPS